MFGENKTICLLGVNDNSGMNWETDLKFLRINIFPNTDVQIYVKY